MSAHYSLNMKTTEELLQSLTDERTSLRELAPYNRIPTYAAAITDGGIRIDAITAELQSRGVEA